jgi:uncharacterized protein (TIGR02118 family)
MVMKVMVTVGFDDDREDFVRGVLPSIDEVVASGRASRGSLDVRLPDRELEQFGDQLMRRFAEQAVIALWDSSADAALDLPVPDGARLVGAYEVEEHVKKDYSPDWPPGTRSPGFKMIAFLHRRTDLTHEQFSAHWRDRHGPLAVARQPAFWHYVQNHVIRGLTDGSPFWDGIGEIHYRSVEDALTGSYDSEEAQRLIWEDVARFLDYESSPTLTTNEWLAS